MAVDASHCALPYPIKKARFSFRIMMLDADGDPTAATTPDTEVTKDNAAAADATEEISATSGMDGSALMTLTGDEMNASDVGVQVKNASGPKYPLLSIVPRVLAPVTAGATLSAGSGSGGTLTTPLAYDVTGCFVRTMSGTGAAGGSGCEGNQARIISTYNTSTGAFTVEPNFETAIDNTTTVDILLPTGVTLGMLKAVNPTTAGRTLTIESDGMAHADVKEIEGADATDQIRDAVVDDATRIDASALNTASAAIGADGAGLTEAGGTGDHLTAVPWNAAWDAEVESEVADALAAYDPPTHAELQGEINDVQADIAALNLAGIAADLATVLAAVDTEVAAIKAKTDQLTFTEAGQVDANVQSINDVELQGAGVEGDSFRPA